MKEPTNVRILIIGGGIGGLTLAHFLLREGYRPDLIEKAETWRPIGAGITLTPNALRVFSHIGLVPDLLEVGNELETGDIVSASGKVLMHIDYAYLKEKYGFSTLGIHRSALHEVLTRKLEGVFIRTGTVVKQIEAQGKGVDIHFSDGTSSHYDLVVGADGIHSPTRSFCSSGTETRYAGYAGWSFVVPNEGGFPRTHVINQLGHGKRFGVIPVGDNQLYCWASTQAPRQDPSLRKLDYLGVRGLMAHMGGYIPAILESIGPNTSLHLGDAEDVLADRWYRSSVVLLGDAAHAITPNLGMGASLAIEDAQVLTACLSQYDEIADVLQLYQLRRKPRVRQVRDRSYLAGAIGQWQGSAARLIRNATLSLLPSSRNARELEQLMMREI